MPNPILPDLILKAFDLEPAEAIAFFEKKGMVATWSWDELAAAAHNKSFTVAKLMNLDLLQDVHEALATAQKEGLTLADFKAQIQPKLEAKGWWGKSTPSDTGGTVTLGTPARLQTIFRTNTQSTYMAARRDQQARNVTARPFLQYVAVADKRSRPGHAHLDGMTLPADDPFWEKNYPPNGFNCRCRVRALSQKQLDREGITLNPSNFKKAKNFKADPGFDASPSTGEGLDYKPDLTQYPAPAAKAYTAALEKQAKEQPAKVAPVPVATPTPVVAAPPGKAPTPVPPKQTAANTKTEPTPLNIPESVLAQYPELEGVTVEDVQTFFKLGSDTPKSYAIASYALKKKYGHGPDDYDPAYQGAIKNLSNELATVPPAKAKKVAAKKPAAAGPPKPKTPLPLPPAILALHPELSGVTVEDVIDHLKTGDPNVTKLTPAAIAFYITSKQLKQKKFAYTTALMKKSGGNYKAVAAAASTGSLVIPGSGAVPDPEALTASAQSPPVIDEAPNIPAAKKIKAVGVSGLTRSKTQLDKERKAYLDLESTAKFTKYQPRIDTMAEVAETWAQERFRGWQASITDEEKHSLVAYKYSDYSPVNRALREAKGKAAKFPDTRLKQIADNLRRVISRSKIPEALIVHRAFDVPALNNAPDGSLVGTTFIEHGFGSTTVSTAVTAGWGKGIIAEIRLPEGTEAAWMEWAVDGGFDEGREAELLLQAGTEFLIVSDTIDSKGNRRLIMEAKGAAVIAPAKKLPVKNVKGFPPGGLSDTRVISSLGGSTGAQLVEDVNTGEKYVLKYGNHADHVRNESQTDKIYAALKLPVPPHVLNEEEEGSPYKLSRFIESVTLEEAIKKDGIEKYKKEIQKGFVVDALLGNWDVIGLSKDNIRVGTDGKVYRVDNGGSLFYRAQGALKKPEQFNGTVTELKSLLDPNVNPSAAQMFAGITPAEIRKQVAAVAKNRDVILKGLDEPLRGILNARIDDMIRQTAR